MKHFNLSFWLYLAFALIAAGAIGFMLHAGHIHRAVLTLTAVIAACAGLWGKVTTLIQLTDNYASALDADDTTVRIAEGDSRRLRHIATTFNRIAENHRHNNLELETRKLYYDRIINVMTHEMRNSLVPIISLSADLEANLDRRSADEARASLSLINTEAEGIKRFLDAYYDLTRVPTPALTELEAEEIAFRLKSALMPELASRSLKPATVKYIAAENCRCTADAALLNQLLVNLMRNALDAVADISNPHIEVSITSEGEKMSIRVTDNGNGIAPGTRARLFEPFFTTKATGCGVGLCLARQLARCQKGDLTLLTSRQGQTCFEVSLPKN